MPTQILDPSEKVKRPLHPPHMWSAGGIPCSPGVQYLASTASPRPTSQRVGREVSASPKTRLTSNEGMWITWPFLTGIDWIHDPSAPRNRLAKGGHIVLLNDFLVTECRREHE